jgi:hypothetical protein
LNPAPSTSILSSTATAVPPSPATSSSLPIVSNYRSSPVVKLPEAFTRSLKHRNCGGMTSDEVMNDFDDCKGDKKQSKEGKQERKWQRLKKTEVGKTPKNMKRQKENPRQKRKRVAPKQD